MNNNQTLVSHCPNPLQILIPQTFIEHFSNSENQARLKAEADLDSVEFSALYILTLDSSKLANKLHALNLVLNDLSHQTTSTYIDNMSLALIIPEASVPVLLGRGSSHLQKIQEKSFTEIKIHEKSNLLLYRKIEIIGRNLDIETAVKHVLLSTRSFQAPRIVTNEEFSSKITFAIKSSSQKLATEELATDLETSLGVQSKLKETKKHLRLSVTGNHCKCKEAIESIVRKMESVDADNKDKIVILIPYSYVVKVIGPKGKLIKEISASSGGAKVIILADKNFTREQKRSEVVVEGSTETKIAAVISLFELLNSIRKEEEFQVKNLNDVICLGVVVPDRLVSKLIGKGGVTVKNMMAESEGSIAFLDTDKRLSTPEGEKGRMVTLKGNPKSISSAIELLLTNIEKFTQYQTSTKFSKDLNQNSR